MKRTLNAERLRELLHYDPDTGVFTRRIKTALSSRMGEIVGSVNQRGYLVTSIDHRLYRLHRLAWLYVHGLWPVAEIDHIDGNPKNNRIANLRDVSRPVNTQNMRRPTKRNTAGFLGVSWKKRQQRWVAQISVFGKTRFIGYFDSADAAHAAYLGAKRALHPGCTI